MSSDSGRYVLTNVPVGPRVVEVPQPKIDRVGLARLRQLVHEALDREDVHIRAKAAQRGDPQWHGRDEIVENPRVPDLIKWQGIAVTAATVMEDNVYFLHGGHCVMRLSFAEKSTLHAMWITLEVSCVQ